MTARVDLCESTSQLDLHDNALGVHNNALFPLFPVSSLLDLDPTRLPELSAFPLVRLAPSSFLNTGPGRLPASSYK